jgi:hypothetical protein
LIRLLWRGLRPARLVPVFAWVIAVTCGGGKQRSVASGLGLRTLKTRFSPSAPSQHAP